VVVGRGSMKFYISARGIKKLTIPSSGGGGKGSPSAAAAAAPANPGRRIASRAVLPAALLLGLALPFLFVRVAFLVLESAAACSASSNDCFGWRFFGGNDAALLREELTRALLEAKVSDVGDRQGVESSVESFDELVKEVTSRRPDIKAFASKTKAMLTRMERKVHSAKKQESIYWHLASHGIPKGLHCLCLKLAEEYAVNAIARSRLPPPQYFPHLADPHYHHVVLITDNVLAASVVISSTVQNSAKPEKLVFHVVTDKKTYTAMHAWFAINPIRLAVVEVKGLHQYDWSQEVNIRVKEMIDFHRLLWKHFYRNLKEEYLDEAEQKYVEALSPSNLYLLNHLRVFIPELFPDLNKVVFLDDDLIVQRDLSPLWELNLEGKGVGAVVNSWCGDDCCPGRQYKDYLNFSHPTISSNFDSDRCAWLYGLNVFDLEAWRRSNLTRNYLNWLKKSLNSGLTLWIPGVLPPALIAFEGQVHPIDPSWHLAGLGHRFPDTQGRLAEAAAVIHFSGPAKPWLEIGSPEVRSLWYRHLNPSNKFIRKCRITG
ncbi:Hexosyltransferase, partial [Psidium guajava]